jgi:hypothetical protein
MSERYAWVEVEHRDEESWKFKMKRVELLDRDTMMWVEDS